VAERDALQHERELVVQSLSERVALRTLVSGRVLAAPARSGDVVAAGQTLFQLADPRGCAWLPSVSMANSASGFVRPRQGSMRRPGRSWSIAARSRWPARRAGACCSTWPMRQPVAGTAGGSQGRNLRDRLVSLPADACAVEADGTTVVWVHRSPERFAPLRLKSCAAGVGAQLAQGTGW